MIRISDYGKVESASLENVHEKIGIHSIVSCEIERKE